MNAPTTNPGATTPMMPTFSTSQAMLMLWEKAAGKLHTHELQWFADGAVEEIRDQTQSLAVVLMDLGALVASDDGGAGSFMDAGSASLLLFNLSHQVSTINGLANISADANDRVRLAHKGLA